MSEPILTESEKLLRDYLAQNRILIVDSVSSGRVSLAAFLAKLGANRQKMSLVGSMAEARQDIQEHQPKIIFADFMIGTESSLDLIEFKKVILNSKEKDHLFVLVTSNASQSTVARAAEEDVDTFIIKPYSFDMFKRALMQAIEVKLRPNLYLRLIDEGKELLFNQKYDEAIVVFEKAMKENPQPTLACFYMGQAEFMKKSVVEAESSYSLGLNYNKIHYKCLVGLFELLHEEKKYADAYEVIKRLAQYFPANPKRLASVLRLAIITNNFQDMEGYYRIFVKVDNRTDELIRYMCSALLVTGKYYLRKKVRSRAVEIFENAAISAAGRLNFLLYIVEALVDFKMKNESELFLKRLQSLAPASEEFAAACFLSTTLNGDPKESIHLGRTLIKKGTHLPSVYEKLIIESIKAGYVDAAVSLAQEAAKKWPEKKKNFTYGFDPSLLVGDLAC